MHLADRLSCLSATHNEPSTAIFGPRQRGVPTAHACAVGCERSGPVVNSRRHSTSYSLNAIIGSMCAARRAGSAVAAMPTLIITAIAEVNVSGSVGVTPYRRLTDRRVSHQDATNPLITPHAATERPARGSSERRLGLLPVPPIPPFLPAEPRARRRRHAPP